VAENMIASTINLSIERGLEFLKQQQLPSGEFKVFMTRDSTMETDCVTDSSPFPTALIAYSLGFSKSEVAKSMLAKVLQFFINEMEGPGLWRYWTKEHKYHDVIPPDLDDVACISYVLQQHGISFPLNKEIVLACRDSRGLFYTWITPRLRMSKNWQFWRVAMAQLKNPVRHYAFWKLNESGTNDIDGIVNANLLFYLGQCKETQPVINYLIDIFQQGKEESCDKWHLNRFTFYYVVARNYQKGITAFESIRNESIARIVNSAKPNGSIGNDEMETALAVCALISWEANSPEIQRAIEFLIGKQGQNGEWPRAILYYGGPKKYYGWGSEELTTGFCLEALLRFEALYS
jgi:hypothetical protein